jgi:hypothetical protein
MKALTALAIFFLNLFFLSSTFANIDLYQQWKNGLKGARLVNYSNSLVSSHSTHTTINFCHDGKHYNYFREGSAAALKMAGGASNRKITGTWDIQENSFGVLLIYVTDQGQSGSFPLSLQSDGKVNIGGTAYTVQSGAADC